jgi:hypothetical protein
MAAEGVPKVKSKKLCTLASAYVFGRGPNFLKQELRFRPNVKNTASVILCCIEAAQNFFEVVHFLPEIGDKKLPLLNWF